MMIESDDSRMATNVNLCDVQHPVLRKLCGQVDELTWRKLIRYECHWNWVRQDFNETEAQIILDRIDSDQKPSPSTTTSESENVFYLKSSSEAKFHEHLPNSSEDDVQSNFLSAANQAFLLIYLGKLDEAHLLLCHISHDFTLAIELEEEKEKKPKNEPKLNESVEMSTSANNTDIVFMDPEILLGYNYIFHSLLVYYRLANGYGLSICLDNPELESLDYKTFPLKTKEVILRFKLRSFGGTRKCFEQIKDVYKELKTVNPRNPAWVAGYYYYTRALRRRVSLQSEPSAEETNAALTFYKLNPQCPLSVSNLCTNMNEIVWHKSQIRFHWPFQYGDKIYKTPDYMLKEICNMSREPLSPLNSGRLKALVMDMNSVDVYLEISTILSWLPYPYKDVSLALKCIDIALRLKPNDPVAQHRKALILLKHVDLLSDLVETEDPRQDAERLLRQSSDPSNKENHSFFALYDLFNILLGDFVKNSVELEERLAENIRLTERWNSSEISKLYFLQGCYKFMIKKRRMAFQDWIEAFLLDSNTNHFTNMQVSMRRFLWDRSLIHIRIVSFHLHRLGLIEVHPRTNNYAKAFQILVDQIENAVKIDKDYISYDKRVKTNMRTKGYAWSIATNTASSRYNNNISPTTTTGSGSSSSSGGDGEGHQQQKYQNSTRSLRNSIAKSQADMDNNWRSRMH